ncbi:MAG: FAD-binding oxidoreductase [Bryobacteraceae bacterium]
MSGPRTIEDASGFRGSPASIHNPATIAELAAVLRDAARAHAPVAIAGGLTGVTGGAIPGPDSCAAWMISLDRMAGLRVDGDTAIAGAGVSLETLHRAAARAGLFYPPDPTEWTASVGGSIATNASGSRSFLYGATRRWIRALTVVMADGEIRRFERGHAVDFPVPRIPLPSTTKNTAGYPLAPGMDWVDLIAGSEGTLAVVAEAELALLPAPRDLITGVVFFDSEEGAIAAVDAWRGVEGLRMLEYMDRASLDLVRARFEDTPQAGAALLYEQEADDDAVDAWVDRIDAAGASPDIAWLAASQADRERFRHLRHALPEAVNDTVRRNGFLKLGSDYAAPVARNREMFEAYRRRLKREFQGAYVLFGHVGDAHLHANILPRSQAEFDRGKEAMLDLAREAVAMGGTVSAEHGLGKRKRHLLELQYLAGEIAAMRAVKTRLDPEWRLSPGNLFA